MTSTATIVDGYFPMWNETDADKRREIIAATWADDANYVDPMLHRRRARRAGRPGAGAQQQFPGQRSGSPLRSTCITIAPAGVWTWSARTAIPSTSAAS